MSLYGGLAYASGTELLDATDTFSFNEDDLKRFEDNAFVSVCIIQVSKGSITYLVDETVTTPTASLGMEAGAGSLIQIVGKTNIQNFRAYCVNPARINYTLMSGGAIY